MLSRQPAALGCVCGIAISWVASTQLSQTLVSGEASGANLFLVWFSTNFNVMLVALLWSTQPRHLSLRRTTTWGGQELPIQKLLRAAMMLYPLWMGANYLYVRALGLTSAATATAVFSTTPAVVAVLSRLLLKESFHARKVGAVVLAIAGVLCVDLAPTVARTGADVAAGDVDTAAADTAVAVGLASVAALCAGSYKVVLRLLLGETSAPPVAVYLSCLGGINIAFGAPLVLAFHLTGFEVVPPMATLPWEFLIASALLHLVFNFLINFGIAFTSPLFISLGIDLQARVQGHGAACLPPIQHAIHQFHDRSYGAGCATRFMQARF